MSSITRSAVSARSASNGFYGHIEPRICVPVPLRDLDDPAVTLGHAAAQFAETIGQPFLPHEASAARHLLELDETTGLLRFRFGLFNAARQNSKTHFARVITGFRMLLAGVPQEVLGVAQDLSQSWYALDLFHTMFQAEPWLRREIAPNGFRRANGRQELRLLNGSRYSIRAANGEAGRGLTCHLCIFDELRTQIDTEGFAAVTSTINAARNGQVLMLSNAGSDKSVVLNDVFARGIAGGPDSKLIVMAWTPPPGCDRHDREAWRYSNPAAGYGTITLDALEAAYEALDPESFRTEVMNERVVALNTAIDLEAWRACADARASLKEHRGKVVACFDSYRDHSVLAVAALLPDGTIRVELVKSWDTIPDARNALGPLLDKIQPAKVAWFPSAGAGFAPILRRRRGSTEITGAGITEACQGLADLVAARQLSHGDAELLNSHIAKAERLPVGDGYRFTRRGSHGSITAAYAAAGAVHVVASGPRPQRARIHIIN